MPPTQYLEFRDSPSGPGSQWCSWHLGWHFSPRIFSIYPLSPHPHMLNVNHRVKQNCLQTFLTSLLGWGVPPHFQQKAFPAASVQNEFAPGALVVCFAHERQNVITIVDCQLVPCRCIQLAVVECPFSYDDTPIPALWVAWDLSQWSKGNWGVGCLGAQTRSQGSWVSVHALPLACCVNLSSYFTSLSLSFFT